MDRYTFEAKLTVNAESDDSAVEAAQEVVRLIEKADRGFIEFTAPAEKDEDF